MSGLNILVIDDAKENAHLLQEHLNNCGHKTDVAFDGDEGIYKYDQKKYDLVLTDVLMPQKDGYDVTKYIKAQNKETYIIAMSGGSAMIPQKMALSAVSMYADDMIKKPFSPMDIEEKINAINLL